MTDFEYALRTVGFFTAALGTCAAVPAATWRLLRQVCEALAALVNVLMRRRHEPGWAPIELPNVNVSASTSATYTATAAVVGDSVEERLDRLEKRVELMVANQQQTAANLLDEAKERRQVDAELRGHLDTQVARLDRELAKQQQTSEEVDTRALPIVLVGAALTTFPDVLSLNAVVGTLAICVGLGFFFWAWVLLEREAAKVRDWTPTNLCQFLD